jgi:hypothetical protein
MDGMAMEWWLTIEQKIGSICISGKIAQNVQHDFQINATRRYDFQVPKKTSIR